MNVDGWSTCNGYTSECNARSLWTSSDSDPMDQLAFLLMLALRSNLVSRHVCHIWGLDNPYLLIFPTGNLMGIGACLFVFFLDPLFNTQIYSLVGSFFQFSLHSGHPFGVSESFPKQQTAILGFRPCDQLSQRCAPQQANLSCYVLMKLPFVLVRTKISLFSHWDRKKKAIFEVQHLLPQS